MTDRRDSDRPRRSVPESQAGAEFLAEASRLLADSLEYETTLATVARLSLPYLGAWCVVDLCSEGEMRRAAVVHSDPELQELARRLEAGWPPERDDPFGVPRAIRTRETEIVREVPDEMLVEVSRSAENLEVLRALGMASLLIVPLLARGDVLGAITYISPIGGWSHTDDDVAVAEDLAARCAVALDNARLHVKVAAALARAEEAWRVAEEVRAAAEEASDATVQFLRTMSHELRTPLNAISAYVDILLMGVHGELTEQQREDLRRIQVSQSHLHSLASQVLDYTRMGARGMRYSIRCVALPEVVAGIEAMVAPLARTKGIALKGLEETMRADLLVRADPDKLAQILVNLISNAVKFTPPGGRVELVCEGREKHVQVQVRDTGIGIAPEDQERIFQPFVQVSGGPGPAESGTGLGLAISRDFARAMDGDLTLVSAPQQGSTFTLILPRGDTRAGPVGG